MLRFLLFLPLCLLAGFATAQPEAAQQVGDRLVVAVNGISYTQRQVEIYTLVKESLRKTPGVSLITASLWPEALEAFGEDMIVLQEAQRLGSYQGFDQLGTRYDAEVREKAKTVPALREAFVRLGMDDGTLRRTLEQVLRVTAFRRSKDRQGEITANRASESARWLEGLKSRAIVRPLQGALTYVIIQPTLGR